jgi:hypothetical protein
MAPPGERPTTPGPSYGVPARGGAMVEWSTVVERLRAAGAYWLATVTPSGRPHVVPVWGVFVRDDLYLEIGAPETAKARNLAANRAVGVHLDGVDDALIIFGTATHIQPGAVLGTELAAAFHAIPRLRTGAHRLGRTLRGPSAPARRVLIGIDISISGVVLFALTSSGGGIAIVFGVVWFLVCLSGLIPKKLVIPA